MNMLILGMAAIITALVVGNTEWDGCGTSLQNDAPHAEFTNSPSGLACATIMSQSYNWAITLIGLGVALLIAALIQGLRTNFGRRTDRHP